MATRYAELVERVAAATGPDQELDCRIAVALDGFFEIEPKWDGGPIGYGYVNDEGTRIEPGHGGAQLVHRYTASIDDAVALVGRVLPGWQVNIYHYGSAGAQASLGGGPQERHEALTTPLAILLAMLRTLASIESKP